MWIDLNNDGVKDDREAVETFDEVVKYDRSDELSLILATIQKTTTIHFEIENKQIIIKDYQK